MPSATKKKRFTLLLSGLVVSLALVLTFTSCTEEVPRGKDPKSGSVPLQEPAVKTPDASETNPKTLISLPADAFKTTTLWYPKADGTGYMEVVRPLAKVVQGKEAALKLSLQQLLAGPSAKETAAGVFSEIPRHVQLKGLQLSPKKDVVTLYLTPNFEEGGGSYSIQARVDQLRQTVKTFYPKAQLMLVLSPAAGAAGKAGLKAPACADPSGIIGGEGLETDAASQEPANPEASVNEEPPVLKRLEKSEVQLRH